MRHSILASVALLGTLGLAACEDNPMGVEQQPALAETGPSLAVSSGESFSYIKITNPSTATASLAPGGTLQMGGTLFYSAGGTLSSNPYAQWRSTDVCVATVTNAYPSWGLVKGLKSGTTKIIAEAWGKADTVTVTVSGTNYPSSSCYDAQWSWNYNDVSFTGTPSTSYGTAGGEALKKLVLFAGPKPDYTILVAGKVTLRSELWYSLGGKLNGKGYVTFSVTDGSVASITSGGVVTGLKPGRTKVIARLGSTYADTVPLYVK
jgi:hypothetical protein